MVDEASHVLPAHSETVVRVERPDVRTNPLIFCSPHSGRDYPDDLLDQCLTPISVLRRSEDAFIDQLYADVPCFGSVFLKAMFPRALVDPNRARNELDPKMFEDATLPDIGPVTSRAAAGLGVIPRLGADGQALYGGRMAYETAQAMLRRFYDPYHQTLKALIKDTQDQFGEAIIIDCHSMPAASARGIDIVLGDRYGASCSRSLITHIEYQLRNLGLTVVRNRPYAGGYITENYGHPEQGVHAIQVEINRSLYMDEARVRPNSKLNSLRTIINTWVSSLTKTQFNHKYAAE